MADRATIESSLFEDSYKTIVRLVMYHDNVHRKNKGFAKQSLRKSGFADCTYKLLGLLPDINQEQILGDVTNDIISIDTFCDRFRETNCRYYINYHDEKVCTVEFTLKFETTLDIVKKLPDDILEELHLEIQTPVGSVQA